MIHQRIFVTCTVGTKKTPILEYFLKTLLARHSIGDRLLNSAPMFAIPIQDKSLQVSFMPLSYDDISAADKIRTNALGAKGIAFRSHLRRKGGASDLFDAGVPKEDILVVGHWSIGVLKAYLSWTEDKIANLQLKGILRAELRSSKGWPSKLMVDQSILPYP